MFKVVPPKRRVLEAKHLYLDWASNFLYAANGAIQLMISHYVYTKQPYPYAQLDDHNRSVTYYSWLITFTFGHYNYLC